MSTIEKLQIQGIRSFGPEERDVQRIIFCKPLTLILGKNGTGKTTIIECLRYATTGDMPPGAARGGAFVHDPKLAREREVKAQVRLNICDVTGARCIISRSLTAKLTDAEGKNIKLTTLDGAIKREKPNGETQSITSRCADLNREMISSLGISKAVLDNVIFCHQEDSNWPLGEGKVLKTKFDSIFDSTRYTKVLEEIKKVQQSQVQDVKMGKEELKYLKQHKDKARELQRDQEEMESKLAASEQRVKEIRSELEPLQARLTEISTKSTEIYDLNTEIQKYMTKKEQLQQTVKDLGRNIKNPYEGSTNQLKRELAEFKSKVQDKREEMDSYDEQRSDVVINLERIARDKNRLLLEVGKLEKEAETHELNVKKRDNTIRDLAEEYDFEGFEKGKEIDDDVYRQFFVLMKGKLEKMFIEGKRKKAEMEEEEKKLQEKIDTLKETKTKLQHSEKLKRETMTKNVKELKDINQKLSRMVTSAGRLDRITTDLKRAENDLTHTESSVNIDDLKSEIISLDQEKKKLDANINELDSEMNQLHKQSEAQTQLNMLNEDKQTKHDTINRLRSSHEDSIIGLLGHMPVEDLRLSVESYITNQTESVRESNLTLLDLKTKLSSREMEKTTTLAQQRQKETELRVQQDKISSICDSENFEEELNEVQKNLNQAQEEKGSLLGADHMINKYIRGLEKNNPSCPLCHRGFDQAQEIRELILKLQEQLRKVPHNLRKAEQDMEKNQKKCNDLIQLKPIKEIVGNLRDAEIPKLKAKLKKIEDEVKKMKESLEGREEELMLKEADLDIAKSMISDIVQMDRYRGEMRELERKIATQQAMLTSSGSSRQLADVISEKEQKQLELETVNRRLDHKRQKISEFQDQVQRLKSKVNSLKEEKLTIEGQLQEKSKLEDTKATLTAENATYQKDIEEARVQLRPLDEKIEKANQDKKELSYRKEKMIELAKEEVDLVKNNGNSVKNFNTEIKNYIQSGKEKHLVENRKKQSQLNSEQARKEEEQDKINEEINTLRREITGQEIKERELNDSLLLRDKEEEIKTLDVNIQDLEEKLGDFDVRNLEKERQRLVKKHSDLTETLHVASGRQNGFREQIKTVIKELKSEMYDKADIKHNAKVIDNRTLEVANKDLNKYYKAMDLAIMRYHNDKMEEINRIILDLWRKTYQGNDIDTIEIRSEDDDSKVIKTRRNYNYRVVMIKNGIPIDMRGRCSAGQKVLASLIIRLALAETFCMNCGVLALDEPTTNLDRNNIENLASSLVEIIKDRHSIRHFQLVVITHDEDFVDLLGKADYVNEFVQVYKNDDGLSQLEMKNVEDLYSNSK